jgi:putative transcriptional regulator
LADSEPVSELAPGFLVAVPQLGDPNFQRALILLMEHGDDGALGIVVNRTGSVNMADVARSQGLLPRSELAGQPVYVGGPVQTERGFVLHGAPGLDDSVEINDGLFVSSSLETLKELLGKRDTLFKLCLGYAGWGPGQLERELQEGAWITAPLSRRHVLETPAPKAWDSVLRDMGIDPAMLQHVGGKH